jgi:hypothetical protein
VITGANFDLVAANNTVTVNDGVGEHRDGCHTAYSLLTYQGRDGKLWCVYWSGAQWVTVQLGTPPVGVTVAGDVVIDNGWNIIYYRGSDNKVYAVQWTGSQWKHTALGGTATV